MESIEFAVSSQILRVRLVVISFSAFELSIIIAVTLNQKSNTEDITCRHFDEKKFLILASKFHLIFKCN